MKIKGGTDWSIEIHTTIEEISLPYPKKLETWFWIGLVVVFILTFYLFV